MTIREMNYNVPKAINRLIEEKGLKQKAVAERSGFTPQGFCDIMNGRKLIKACDIAAIATALGVEPNDLFDPGNKHATA